MKQKQTHRYREQPSGYQWGEGGGRGELGVGDAYGVIKKYCEDEK